MGFERIVKKITLQFKQYEGLEVVMRSLDTEQFLVITGQADEVANLKKFSDIANSQIVRELFGATVQCMISWNLEDDGVPIPIALAQCVQSGQETSVDGKCKEHSDNRSRCQITGLMAQEFEFVIDIINTWLGAIAGVSPPLPKSSNNGGTFPEASLPMETLSTSLGS